MFKGFLPLILPDLNITIRRFNEDDASAIVHHANNPKIYEMLSAKFKQPYTKQDAISWISANSQALDSLNLAITVHNNVVGGIGLRKNSSYPTALQLGYWLSEELWGKGIMTTVVKSIVNYAFSQKLCKHIIAFTFLSNHPSMRVLEKAGFEKKESSDNNPDTILYMVSC